MLANTFLQILLVCPLSDFRYPNYFQISEVVRPFLGTVSLSLSASSHSICELDHSFSCVAYTHRWSPSFLAVVSGGGSLGRIPASPSLHLEVSLSKILNPKLLMMSSWHLEWQPLPSLYESVCEWVNLTSVKLLE